MIYLLLILWFGVGIWRAYKYLSWDIRDEGCLFFYHITRGIRYIIFGLFTWVEYHLSDVVIIGYYPSERDRYIDGRYLIKNETLYIESDFEFDLSLIGLRNENGFNLLSVSQSGVINKLLGLNKTNRKEESYCSITEWQFDKMYKESGLTELNIVDGEIVIGEKIEL